MAEGHRKRLRERIYNQVSETIPEYMVLEYILQGVILRRDTCQLARDLISEFGSLSNVIEAPLEKLLQFNGLGEAAAYHIKLLPKLNEMYNISKHQNITIFHNLDEIGSYIYDICSDKTKECIYLLCMDSNMKLLKFQKIAEGTVNAVNITIRKILEVALMCNASRVVLAHTHPGGNALPSQKDIDSTKRILLTLHASGLTLDDHIVIAGDDFVSIRQSNIIEGWG